MASPGTPRSPFCPGAPVGPGRVLASPGSPLAPAGPGKPASPWMSAPVAGLTSRRQCLQPGRVHFHEWRDSNALSETQKQRTRWQPWRFQLPRWPRCPRPCHLEGILRIVTEPLCFIRETTEAPRKNPRFQDADGPAAETCLGLRAPGAEPELG